MNDTVRTILVNNAGVTALVGTKIYANRGKQTDDAPYVVIRQLGVNPHHTKSAVSTYDDVRISIYILAARYITSGGVIGAKNVAHAIRTALDKYTGTVDGVIVKDVTFTDEDSDDINEANYSAVAIRQDYTITINR